MGRPLLPAAAMMELAAATAATMTQDSAHDSGDLLAISNMSISAPIILPAATAPGAGDSDSFEVVCSLDLATGRLSIGYAEQFQDNDSFEPITCATATASIVKAKEQPQQQPSLQAAAAALLADIMAKPAGAAAAGAAMGSIAPVSGDWTASGYFSAPQQVDSALHLGVVAPGSGAKVPVALGSFLVPCAAARAAGTGWQHASTCIDSSKPPTEAGVSSSSFILRGASSAGAAGSGRSHGQASAVGADAGGLVVVVEDLQTKVVKQSNYHRVRSQRQHATAAASPEVQQHPGSRASHEAADGSDSTYPCSYELEWQMKEAATAAAASQLDSRQAGKLSLLVHESPAAAGSEASQEHVVLQLRPEEGSGTLTAAAAAASTLALLQQVNQVQQAHAAAGGDQQVSLHAAMSLAGTALASGSGLQDHLASSGASDAGSAVWGLLRTEAKEQSRIAVSLQATDASAPQQLSILQGGLSVNPGALQATAVRAAALEVPRLLPCSKPEGAEFITIRPEPRSALSNLVARAADIGQVGAWRQPAAISLTMTPRHHGLLWQTHNGCLFLNALLVCSNAPNVC